MEIITEQQYEAICRNAQVLQSDSFGIKVLRLADGQIVKSFRRKRLLSSALLYPYAYRFQKNALRLTAAGIRTVKVNRLCYCPSRSRHLVFYEPVPGICLRSHLADASPNCQILKQFAEFFAELHAKGIYFRSFHFGNVFVLPDSEGFALIDMADLSFRSAPLDFTLRLRNFRHLLRYEEDINSLERFGEGRFVAIYARKAGLSEAQGSIIHRRLSLAMHA